MTTSEAVISLDKIFKPGMAYVALSRVTSLQGLHLQNFNPRSIYCDPAVERALNAMTSASILPFWQVLVAPSLEEQHLLIASHNTEGFPHVQDIECNHFLHKADIFDLQETWLLSDCDTKNAPLIIMQSSITETIHHLKAFQNHYKAKTKEEFRYLFMKTLIFL
jgi:hypothetical protein